MMPKRKEEKPRKVTIRKATPYDVVKIGTMLEKVYEDSGGLYPEPDRFMVINWVTSIITTGYVVVAECGGRMVGSVAVTEFHFPWSPKWYLYVDWIYVVDGFREGGTFDALAKAVHDFADEKDAPIYGGISNGKRATLKDKLMAMKGYHYLGGQFIRPERSHRSMEAEDGRQLEENDHDYDEAQAY